MRAHHQDLARVHQNVGGVGIGEARCLGPADHVHVQVSHDFREVEKGEFGKVLRAA
jgi:hypothetical protein